MKKFISCILAVCLIVPFAFLLSGCGEAQPQNSVTLSINPELSFVLDANDKVLSITYGNEDSGTIFANINFVGMDINEAIQKFIENSAISGHVTLDGDVITVQVDGINAEKMTALEEKTKTQIESVFENLGVTIQVQIREVSDVARKQMLIATAMVLAPEYTNDELNEMTIAQLLKVINDKQKEYNGLAYTQIAQIQEQFSAAQNSLLQNIQTLKAQIAEKQEEIDGLLEEYADFIPSLIQQQIESARGIIRAAQDQVNAKLADAMETFKNFITAAKAEAETKLAQLKTAFDAEVLAVKDGFIAHLDTALSSGEITQEQYDYWKALVENN